MTTADQELVRPENNLIRSLIKDEAEKHWGAKGGNVEDVLHGVYSKIGSQVLAQYHSDQPWAFNAWCMKNMMAKSARGNNDPKVKRIDKDGNEVDGKEVTNAADMNDNELANRIMGEVVAWHENQECHPVKSFVETLQTQRRSECTITAYTATASRFVAFAGEQWEYSDQDVMAYLKKAEREYPNQNTYLQECQRLLQFLRHLPNGQGRKLPIEMPKKPAEYWRPAFTFEDVEKLIWGAAIDGTNPDMLARLLISTIYGARRGELTDLNNDPKATKTVRDKDGKEVDVPVPVCFDLNSSHPTVYIRTLKHGQRKEQPLPQCVLPILSVPVRPMSERMQQYYLKKMCRKAGVRIPYRAGWHSFRRRTAREVRRVERSDTDVSNFMRWSPGRSNMLNVYAPPDEESDAAIIEKHPFVKIWEEVAPYVLKYNKWYESMQRNTAYG